VPRDWSVSCNVILCADSHALCCAWPGLAERDHEVDVEASHELDSNTRVRLKCVNAPAVLSRARTASLSNP